MAITNKLQESIFLGNQMLMKKMQQQRLKLQEVDQNVEKIEDKPQEIEKDAKIGIDLLNPANLQKSFFYKSNFQFLKSKKQLGSSNFEGELTCKNLGKLCYCSLKDDCFVCYPEKIEEKTLIDKSNYICLNFQQVKVEYSDDGGANQFTSFTLAVPDKQKFVFSGIKSKGSCFVCNNNKKNDDNEVQRVANLMNQWKPILQKSIISTNSIQKPRDILNQIPKFWQNNYISYEDFIEEAETLDILLFKTKNNVASLQRFISGSDFDHVGFIFKDEDTHKVHIADCTSDEGVALTTFDLYKKYRWFEVFDKIAYRKLVIDKTDSMCKTLQEFLERVLHNNYSLSAKKLLTFKSAYMNQEEQKQSDEQRSFFCSEFVATALKRLKLLPEEKSANAYWPVSFSSKKNLQLLNGAYLKEEVIINFEI